MARTTIRNIVLIPSAVALAAATMGAAPAAHATTPRGSGTRAATATMRVHLVHSLGGRTLKYRASVSGWQHLMTAGGKVFANPQPTGVRVYLDGRNINGTDGGDVACTKKGKVAVNMSFPWASVKLSRGHHTLRYVAWYCGRTGQDHVAATTSVVVR